jgi:putative CocE/NonD family hydrolase
MGPWHHGQEIDSDIGLGPVSFGSDTGLYFRWHILKPFLDQYLVGGPPAHIATVNAFESGTNRWLRLDAWPQGCEAACPITQKPIFMQPAASLGFDKPAEGEVGSYISDPNKPVPFIQRPIHLLADDEALVWRNWLGSDQREASTRPDVLTYRTAPLTEPLKIAGQPIASLLATTTGTDGDFVVKLIDQYPDEVAQQPEMGGYQFMVSADILRGRFRNSFENPSAIPAGVKQTYRFTMPVVNHVFLPGHRIMVQIQSTWFPLYDRNPQIFVPNIFFAKKGDYQAASIKLLAGSEVILPVVEPKP